MVRWRDPKSLEDELASYGVRVRRLSSELLVAHPEVLQALYGAEAVANGDQLAMAMHVETVILSFVRSLHRDKNRQQVVEALLRITRDYWDKSMSWRKDHLRAEYQITPSLLRALRKELLAEIAAELRDSIRTEARSGGRLLSSDARRAGRQLAWFAQEVLVHIEGFDGAVRGTAVVGERMREIYGRPDGTLARRTPESDRVVWAYTHCLLHLGELELDDTGRDFVRDILGDNRQQDDAENLTTSEAELLGGLNQDSWRADLLDHFTARERQTMQRVLAQTVVDEPVTFIDKLTRVRGGAGLHEKWLHLLSAPGIRYVSPTGRRLVMQGADFNPEYDGGFRGEVIHSLRTVLRALESAFPEHCRARGELAEIELRLTRRLFFQVYRGFAAGGDSEAVERAVTDGPHLWTGALLFERFDWPPGEGPDASIDE